MSKLASLALIIALIAVFKFSPAAQPGTIQHCNTARVQICATPAQA